MWSRHELPLLACGCCRVAEPVGYHLSRVPFLQRGPPGRVIRAGEGLYARDGGSVPAARLRSVGAIRRPPRVAVAPRHRMAPHRWGGNGTAGHLTRGLPNAIRRQAQWGPRGGVRCEVEARSHGTGWPSERGGIAKTLSGRWTTGRSSRHAIRSSAARRVSRRNWMDQIGLTT
jgi:hypothetical protein